MAGREVVTMWPDTPHTHDPQEAERLLREHGKVMLLERPMEPGGVPGKWIAYDIGGNRRTKKFKGVGISTKQRGQS